MAPTLGKPEEVHTILTHGGLTVQVRPQARPPTGEPLLVDQLELVSSDAVTGGALLHSVEVAWTPRALTAERVFVLFLNVRLYDGQPRPLLDEGMLRRLWAAGRTDRHDDEFLDLTGERCVRVNVVSRAQALEVLQFSVGYCPLRPCLAVMPDQLGGC